MEDEDIVGKRIMVLLKSYKGHKGTVRYQGTKGDTLGQYGIELDVKLLSETCN